ncbi:MAG: hypothetical protein ED559_13495 [Phycisphaera sp.]|nr:MAG: hypothetical protein ED559_13495 [Phycisphaera sp.]
MNIHGLPMVSALVIGFVFLLAGCNQKYTVDLTNSTRSTLVATLELESLGSGQKVLTKSVLGPGEYRTMGPVEAPFTERVRITVMPAAGAGGFSERRRLDPGKSFVDVAADDYGGASLTITVRRDP